MNELYEALGRKQLQLEQQDAAYSQILRLVAEIVCGKIDRTRVLVNLTDRTWAVSEPGTRPATPGTINGVPECVVAAD